jgi:5-methyltetrahydrofolate--homocysteine methyltransferase
MDDQLKRLEEAVQKGDHKSVEKDVEDALKNGIEPLVILEKGLVPGMQALGKLFKDGEVYLPEILIASRAMNMGVEKLMPHLQGLDRSSKGKILLGTIEGDLHDIGKNLVRMMLEGNGFEVFDIGIDVSPDMFVKEANDKSPDIIAISSLLTTTMISIPKVVEAIKEAGLGSKIKILIGGAPITHQFAEEIGAQGYAPDCASAVDEAIRLMKEV